MVKPTLERPDLILEEIDPKEGAERDSKLLFIKTFTKPDGSRYVHFESVTVKRDDTEVSISSHEISPDALNRKMQHDKVLHLNNRFLSSEWRLTEPQKEGPDLVPTPTDDKVNVSSVEKQISEDESLDTTKPMPVDKEGEPQFMQTTRRRHAYISYTSAHRSRQYAIYRVVERWYVLERE